MTNDGKFSRAQACLVVFGAAATGYTLHLMSGIKAGERGLGYVVILASFLAFSLILVKTNNWNKP